MPERLVSNPIPKALETIGDFAPIKTVAGPLYEIMGSPIQFPHGESAIKKLQTPDVSPEEWMAFARLTYDFFITELRNSSIYESKDGQASFPYTKINITDYAKSIYNGNPFPLMDDAPSGVNIDVYLQPRKHKMTRKYFVFGSFLNTKNGQFTMVEQVEHEYAKNLRTILRQIDCGEEPDEVEIYTLGSPTSQYGHEGPKFAKGTKNRSNVYSVFGGLYGEFIDATLPTDPAVSKNTSLTFHGYSMGSSFAAATAQNLIEQGKITQSEKVRSETGAPLTQVLMDYPAGYHKKWSGLRAKLQTNIGYALDAIWPFLTRPENRAAFLAESGFIDNLTPLLKNRGFKINLDKSQQRAKRTTIKALTDAIRYGADFDREKVKVTIIRRGTYDLSMFTLDFWRKVQAKKTQMAAVSPIPLGVDIIDMGDNTRTFAINSNHMPHFLRPNEIRRLKQLAQIYVEFEKLGKIKQAA